MCAFNPQRVTLFILACVLTQDACFYIMLAETEFSALCMLCKTSSDRNPHPAFALLIKSHQIAQVSLELTVSLR